MLRSSGILNECNLYCKILKNCMLSKVCMTKAVPHSTVSPQMWCINGIKGWFTRTQICWQERRSNYNLRWSRAVMALKCDRRWLLFLGVHMRLSSRCNIWFTFGLFVNYLSPKSHECALKLTELWNTSIFFYLNYDFIDESFAFSPG